MTERKTCLKPAALCGWFCIGLSLLLWPMSATADDIDHNEALALTEQGMILPLQTLIADALQRYPGRFLKAELERDDGRYFYELEIVTHAGKVIELEYDAVSGTLLDIDEDD